jgi:phosphate starvation-inducible PhoH-like protein
VSSGSSSSSWRPAIPYPSDVEYAPRILSADRGARLREIFLDTIYISAHKRTIAPKSLVQKHYIDAMRNFDIVFGIGPAGTGKTYLAMAMAVAALQKSQVARIVLTRPAVEAGERLGFLPGDLAEKVNPYLRPLYDALNDMVDAERARRYMERGTIEVAPLAFMRGRTLNDSFVILDEAQNTTREQMKMFLTRLGYGSKAVITGDVTQIDLPLGKASGLIEAREILRDIRGIRFVQFSERDVVRHRLVRRSSPPTSGRAVAAAARSGLLAEPVVAREALAKSDRSQRSSRSSRDGQAAAELAGASAVVAEHATAETRNRVREDRADGLRRDGLVARRRRRECVPGLVEDLDGDADRFRPGVADRAVSAPLARRREGRCGRESRRMGQRGEPEKTSDGRR